MSHTGFVFSLIFVTSAFRIEPRVWLADIVMAYINMAYIVMVYIVTVR